jgi:carbon-monoxide dehydrogenase large subunit
LADIVELRAEQRRRRAAHDQMALGIGVSMYVEVTTPMIDPELATVTVTEAGTAVVTVGTAPQGQGHATSWAMLVSGALGIPLDAVLVCHGDTDAARSGNGTLGSRSLQTWGMAIHGATAEVARRGRLVAAKVLEADEGDIVLDADQGRFQVAGSPDIAVTWAEVAAAAMTGWWPPSSSSRQKAPHSLLEPIWRS